MRVLGVDPGLRVTGYGAVDLAEGRLEPTLVEGGAITLKAREPLAARLTVLSRELGEVMDDLKPAVMVVEELFAHYAHPRTAILMGHARGVILLAAEQRGVAVETLRPTEVKKALTGNGHATKQQMQRAVAAQCNLAEPPEPNDVADGIALALCGARRMAVARL